MCVKTNSFTDRILTFMYMPFLQQKLHEKKVNLVTRFRSQNTNVVQKHKHEEHTKKFLSFSHVRVHIIYCLKLFKILVIQIGVTNKVME